MKNYLIRIPLIYKCLLFATLFHIVFLTQITFYKVLPKKIPHTPLEIALSQHNDPPPDAFDYLSNQNQQGNGSLQEKKQNFTPKASLMHEQKHLEKKENFLTSSSEKEHNFITNKTTQIEKSKSYSSENHKNTLAITPNFYLSISNDFKGLNARESSEKQINAKKYRNRFANSVTTFKSIDSKYLNLWRQQMEKIGTQAFPKDQYNQKIFGKVKVFIAIHASGKVLSIRIIESSGNKQLDNATLALIKKAMPFPQFPQELSKHTDILKFIRTWHFKKRQ